MMNRELFVFLIMIACGGMLSLIFDVFRGIRTVLKPNDLIVSISDILFWLFVGFVIVAVVWNFNNGVFRFYEPVGIALGGVFYFLLFSKWILKIFLFIFENIFKFLKFILKILLTPPQFLYKILIVPINKYVKLKRQKGQGTYDE